MARPEHYPRSLGWAAVTGRASGSPALLLFAIVFYWTPPHFWALSLRIRKDYAAAGVPMLPVVKGIPETTRQIALYTVLMVAISLVLWAVARMGRSISVPRSSSVRSSCGRPTSCGGVAPLKKRRRRARSSSTSTQSVTCRCCSSRSRWTPWC